MQRRTWILGVIAGLSAGSLVSLTMTIADWLLNPGGLFRNEHGTDWLVVAETAVSWFWPVALIALFTTVVVYSCIVRIRNR